MKELIIVSLVVLGFFAYKNNSAGEKKTSEREQGGMDKNQSSLLDTGCYSYNTNNNVIKLEITNLESGFKGNLIYALAGKARNTGVVVGEINGDKLWGEYTFRSEGVESKREVAFLIQGMHLIEGHGGLNENGTAFVD